MNLHPNAGQWFYLLTGTEVLKRRLFKVWDWAVTIHHRASWRELAEANEIYSSIYAVRQSNQKLPDDAQVVYGNLTDGSIFLVHQSELSEVILSQEQTHYANMGLEAYRVVGKFLLAVIPNGRKARLVAGLNDDKLNWLSEWLYDDLAVALDELQKWELDTAEPDRWVRTQGKWGTRIRPYGESSDEYTLDDKRE